MMSTLDEPTVILKKLRAIRAELSVGIYDPTQAVGIAAAVEVYLEFVNTKSGRRRERITKGALYDSIDVSRSVISNVISRRHVPKMENFFPVVDGLILAFERELGLKSISLEAIQGVPATLLVVGPRHDKTISHLSELLAELVDRIKASNSGFGGVLGDFERAQLITILEMALANLKSPAVETTPLRKLTGWLQDLAGKTVKKGGEVLVGTLASDAAREIGKLLKGML